MLPTQIQVLVLLEMMMPRRIIHHPVRQGQDPVRQGQVINPRVN